MEHDPALCSMHGGLDIDGPGRFSGSRAFSGALLPRQVTLVST